MTEPTTTSQAGGQASNSEPEVTPSAPSGDGSGIVLRLLLLYAAWCVLTVPTWLLLVGVGSVPDVLRMGVGMVVVAVLLATRRFLAWQVDPLRFRNCLLAGLLVQIIAGPVILAMDPGGAMWLTILGVAAAQRSYPPEGSAQEVTDLMVLFCIWVGARLLPSQGAAVAGVAPRDLRSFEPLALFWLAFVVTLFLFASVELQSALLFWDSKRLVTPGPFHPGWRKAGGCSVVAASGALVLLSYAGFLLGFDAWRGWIGAGAIGVGVFLGVVVGDIVGGRLSRSLTAGTLRRLGALFSLGDYLADRTKLLGAFVLGYAALALWFGAAFQVLSRAHPDSFRGIPLNASFDTFLYTSVITLGTVGYGDIVPATRGARVLVMLEVFAGMIWSTVVFAGVVWYAGAERPKPLDRQGPASVGIGTEGGPNAVIAPPRPSGEGSPDAGTGGGA